MPVTLAVRLPKEKDKRPNHELENKMQDCISKGDTSMSVRRLLNVKTIIYSFNIKKIIRQNVQVRKILKSQAWK